MAAAVTPTPIPRCKVGDASLVSAEYANKLIDAINAIQGATIAPKANVGTFAMAGGSFILDLTVCDGRISRLESINAVYNTAGTVGGALVAAAANIANFRTVNNQFVCDFTPLQNTLQVLTHPNAIAYNLAASNIATFTVNALAYLLDFTALANRLANIEANIANANIDSVTAMNARLTNAIYSLNHVTANANCNPNTNSITFTVAFPNVPAV